MEVLSYIAWFRSKNIRSAEIESMGIENKLQKGGGNRDLNSI